MKGIWTLFFGLLLLSPCWAQKPITAVYLDAEAAAGAHFIGKNIFNSSYFVKDHVLVEKRGNAQREYQNLSLGPLDFVDLVNPMQLSLFYKRFNTVVLLDKELAPIKTIRLADANPQLIPAYVGMSSQNRLWLWDDATNQLGQLSLQTLVFQSLTTAFLEPVIYRSSDVNYFYWISKDNKLFYSDIYGKVKQPYTLPPFDRIQIINKDKILYINDNQLYYLDLPSGISSRIDLREKSISAFFFNTQILSIFTDLEIKNYLITLP
ncbi:hypothetical protein [Flavobacterium sp. JP2137]|uniref:hypothetical protein n=1 Tax=Flavobacterium sp. JP2137 TaxID=3414510 RepID=UPI003D2FB587